MYFNHRVHEADITNGTLRSDNVVDDDRDRDKDDKDCDDDEGDNEC